ncbi:unnamed protein product [Mytilus coruscus]|uniref:Uncharacterized protein n=1 Tax=Mytilus coruscus TaxID=42192 RepID=A0A6J8A0Z3_MYTCO|nr:unnamed protein product [Mytilus coruscus]
MSLLTKESFTEAQPSELELFQLPPYQLGVESISYEEIRPTSQVTGYNPITFSLSGSNGMEYLDLKRSKLYVKLRVKHANGQDAKATQLTSMLFYKDRSGHMDSLTTNTGAYERRKFISSSKSVDLQGPLYHELFQMDRYLLNMTDVCLKLFRNKPSFCLMSDEENPNYDIIIEDIAIKVCKIRVNPAIIYAHSLALQKSNAKYPFTKSAIKHLSLVKGSTNAILEMLNHNVS